MHIDTLINTISNNNQQLSSLASAEQFMAQFSAEDRMALVAAMYIGRDFGNSPTITFDYSKGMLNGTIKRDWFSTEVPDADIGRIMFEKRGSLANYFNSFLRCTTASGYDRVNF